MSACMQMALAHDGAGEQLVTEVPRAKASQAAFEASNKLYRFTNSSGNYATVMATVRPSIFAAHCNQSSMALQCHAWHAV